jgi:translocation and assembly module TamB
MKLLLRASLVVVVLLLLLTGTGVWIAQSDWLRERVRSEIITGTERVTGGKVELGAFRFDWHTLTAQVDRFVIHGTEPADQAPLLRVERATVELEIISLFARNFRLRKIEAIRPEAHLILGPDGKTNIPEPKVRKAGKGVAEIILDLKIARFDLSGGSFLLESAGQPPRIRPWEAHGDNLTAQLAYEEAVRRYSGTISLAALQVKPLVLQITASASMEQDRILITQATVKSAQSELTLRNTQLNHFAAPVWTGQYQAKVVLKEFTKLARGTLLAEGSARYVSLSDYQSTGKASSSDFSFDVFHNLRVAADFDADPVKISVKRARVLTMGGEITGAGELVDFERYKASGRAAHFNLAQVVALYTKQKLPYNASIAGPFDVQGTFGSIRGSASLTISPAKQGPSARGEIAVKFDTATRKVDLGHSYVDLPASHVEATGTLGESLTVQLNSRDANDLLPFLPGTKPDLQYGALTFAGTVAGPLDHPLIAGLVTAQNVKYQQQILDSVAGDFTVNESRLTIGKSEAIYAGVPAKVSGSVDLSQWQISEHSPLNARVELTGAELSRVLLMAGQKDVPVSGTVSGVAQLTGVVGDPKIGADVTLSKGLIYGQPFDSVSGRAQVISKTAESFTGLFISGSKRVNISVRLDQTGTRFPDGNLEFNLTSNTMPLNEINLVRERQPDIKGFGKFHADGVLKLAHNGKNELQFDIAGLNADASANSLELTGRNLGDARFIAQTKGSVLTARFDSNAASALIHGDGTMQLGGDYAVEGKVKFSDLGLNPLATLIMKADSAPKLNFDGTAEGELNFKGPARRPEEIIASLDIPRIEVHPLPGTDFARTLPNFVVTNNGPIRISINKQLVRVESARLKAPDTDLSLTGTIDLVQNELAQRKALNLRAQGNMNLALVRSLSPDITSSGALSIDGTIRGSWANPEITGRAVMRGGEFHYADFSNGLSSATGEIVFSGNRATIQSLSAESGGGRVDVTGFAALSNSLLAFRLQATARGVRVRYPEGVSSISDADLTLAGTSQRSEVSGLVTVRRVAINPKSDAASILAASAQPLKTASARNTFASNMNLDVQITTASDVALQTSVTQSLQADANLRLRGTLTNPALLGRVNITQGEIVFFGNKYNISQGTISFLNPTKVEPILNIDLETKARGVDVILTLSGPLDKLGVTYRSDPPLQFSDIVALLATGRAPGDPTLAITSSGQSQSFQQLAANTLIGQAIANPVAGRLQRFFGVSRIKIDPQLTGITGSPQARLTIEQQVTPEILFTYITDVSSTSTQLIRVEWAFNKAWSAILIREENGYVGLDFNYKKRFK